MLPLFIIFFQCIQDHLEVFFVAKKVSIRGIYKKGFDIVLFNIMRVGFLDIK